MIFFYIAENIIEFSLLFANFTKDGKERSNIDNINNFIFLIGIPAVLQSYGFTILKKTKDPLDSVSRLDFVQLVSITQKQTKQYIVNFR